MLRAALAVVVYFIAAVASAQVQTMGDISFAPPDGWKFELRPGADHASVSLSNGARFCVLAVYRAFASSGDAETDFKSAWTQIVTRNFNEAIPSPIYDHKAGAGYPGKKTGTDSRDRTRHYWMYLLLAGRRAVPILAVANSREDLDNLHHREIAGFVEGIRVGGTKAQPPKTTITMADLAGEWQSGASSSVNYVDRSTGAYAGSSSLFYGEGYVIKTDGTYSYRIAGKSNGQTIRDQGAGTVELSAGYIGFREKSSNRLRRYWFITYQQAPDGSTLLTLLQDSYPVTSSNIGMYGTKWTRPAPK